MVTPRNAHTDTPIGGESGQKLGEVGWNLSKYKGNFETESNPEVECIDDRSGVYKIYMTRIAEMQDELAIERV